MSDVWDLLELAFLEEYTIIIPRITPLTVTFGERFYAEAHKLRENKVEQVDYEGTRVAELDHSKHVAGIIEKRGIQPQ